MRESTLSRSGSVAVDADPLVPTRRAALVAAVSAAAVLFAVALEVLAGSAANSTVPSWATWVVPLAWPQYVRVVWWLAVAVAALAFRLSLRRLGLRQRSWLVVVSVAPFVIFATGIAFSADWATWH